MFKVVLSQYVTLELRKVYWKKLKLNKCEIFYASPSHYERCLNKFLQSLNGRVINIINLERFAKNLRGFYAIIIACNSNIYIISDRVRSIPLYYKIDHDFLIITDNVRLIEDPRLERDRIVEFLSVGYVTGRKTLLKDYFQTEAGEILNFSREKGGWKIYKKVYYILFENNIWREFRGKSGSSSNLHLKKFFEVLDIVTERLIKFADGRLIVIPLSGGRDSRLILHSLVKKGYKELLAYSYGTEHSLEARISKFIADKYHVKWEFVKYTPKKWKSIVESQLFQEYKRFAFNYSSLPHIQDLLAIMELKKEKLLNGDSIIVPGHTGDFVAGGHIPSHFFNLKNRLDLGDVISSIIEYHYNLSPLVKMKELKNLFEKFISESLCSTFLEDSIKVQDNFDAIRYFEIWDWKERQSKFIVNSLRVYEFFNFDWWIPLWDYEFVEFWAKVPMNFRKDRWWYNKIVDEITGFKMGGKQKIWHIGSVGERVFGHFSVALGEFVKGLSNNYLYGIFQNLGLINVLRGYKFNGIYAYNLIADEIGKLSELIE